MVLFFVRISLTLKLLVFPYHISLFSSANLHMLCCTYYSALFFWDPTEADRLSLFLGAAALPSSYSDHHKHAYLPSLKLKSFPAMPTDSLRLGTCGHLLTLTSHKRPKRISTSHTRSMSFLENRNLMMTHLGTKASFQLSRVCNCS